MEFSSLAADGAVNHSGVVWLYRYRDGVWAEQGRITHDNAGAFDHFGYALSIDYPYLAIGTPRYVTDQGEKSGAVFVYHIEDDGYGLEDIITSENNGRAYDYFGSSVDLDGGALRSRYTPTLFTKHFRSR